MDEWVSMQCDLPDTQMTICNSAEYQSSETQHAPSLMSGTHPYEIDQTDSLYHMFEEHAWAGISSFQTNMDRP